MTAPALFSHCSCLASPKGNSQKRRTKPANHDCIGIVANTNRAQFVVSFH